MILNICLSYLCQISTSHPWQFHQHFSIPWESEGKKEERKAISFPSSWMKSRPNFRHGHMTVSFGISTRTMFNRAICSLIASCWRCAIELTTSYWPACVTHYTIKGSGHSVEEKKKHVCSVDTKLPFHFALSDRANLWRVILHARSPSLHVKPGTCQNNELRFIQSILWQMPLWVAGVFEYLAIY